ncbi:MAG TPA: response regulator [Sandaracinaceae bacterium LLY-WYZ-13_1]|nr:response regulator [Sandaracinaceae bacterium LLY-WYZ-13_1]
MTGLVLIAEGDPFNLRLLEELCEEAGFDIVTAGDGETALNVIARQRPELILLDAGLSTDDGADVLAVLQADAALATIPVLLTTDADDEEARKRGLELGAADFVTRPYRVFEVEQRVRNLLRLAAAERAAKRARDSLTTDLADDTDPLTHAGGPARLRITLEYEATRAVRYEHALTCVVLRVANLQAVVARSGEETGQGLLVQLASNLRRAIRSLDHLFRSDDDEFTLLLPDTDAAAATAVVERFRAEGAGLAGMGIEPAAELTLGAASIGGSLTDGEALLQAARASLRPLSET